MTMSEMMLLEMLRATTIALRIVTGRVSHPFISVAREMATSIVTDPMYRGLDEAQRAACADAGAAVMEAVAHTKGLK